MLHNLQNYFEVLSQTDSLHVDCCPVLLLMWVVLSSSSCGSLSCPPPHVGRCPVLLLMWVVVLSSSSCGSLSCPPPHVGHCPVLLLLFSGQIKWREFQDNPHAPGPTNQVITTEKPHHTNTARLGNTHAHTHTRLQAHVRTCMCV